MMSLLDNFGKPEGTKGKLLQESLKNSHGDLAQWAFTHYTWTEDTCALDIGCGGGLNVKRILALAPKGKACGIDSSSEAIRRSIANNLKDAGKRCEFKQGTPEKLPCEDAVFDVATAIDAIYFWEDVPKAFREILRVLKPGGLFLAACKMTDPEKLTARMARGVRIYTRTELGQFFADAGFRELNAYVTPRGWLCITGVAQKEAPFANGG